jgi:hypothetical protein
VPYPALTILVLICPLSIQVRAFYHKFNASKLQNDPKFAETVAAHYKGNFAQLNEALRKQYGQDLDSFTEVLKTVEDFQDQPSPFDSVGESAVKPSSAPAAGASAAQSDLFGVPVKQRAPAVDMFAVPAKAPATAAAADLFAAPAKALAAATPAPAAAAAPADLFGVPTKTAAPAPAPAEPETSADDDNPFGSIGDDPSDPFGSVGEAPGSVTAQILAEQAAQEEELI